MSPGGWATSSLGLPGRAPVPFPVHHADGPCGPRGPSWGHTWRPVHVRQGLLLGDCAGLCPDCHLASLSLWNHCQHICHCPHIRFYRHRIVLTNQ